MVAGVLLVWDVETVPLHPALGLSAFYDTLAARAALIASSVVCLDAMAFDRVTRARSAVSSASSATHLTKSHKTPP